MGLCDEPCVFGVRCPAGHGLCEEHSEDLCRAVSGYQTDTTCVVVGCDETYCEASFERSGVSREVVASCVQRLHRDAFDREAEAARAAERARRENDPLLSVSDLQCAVNLRRPCCQQIFGDFAECLAVKCDYGPCGKYFCGLCLDAAFEDKWECHAHARACNQRYFGDNNFFLLTKPDETEEDKTRRHAAHYERVRVRQMRSFLEGKGVEMPPPPVNSQRVVFFDD